MLIHKVPPYMRMELAPPPRRLAHKRYMLAWGPELIVYQITKR